MSCKVLEKEPPAAIQNTVVAVTSNLTFYNDKSKGCVFNLTSHSN